MNSSRSSTETISQPSKRFFVAIAAPPSDRGAVVADSGENVLTAVGGEEVDLLGVDTELYFGAGLDNAVDGGLLNDLDLLAGGEVYEVMGVQSEEHAVVHDGGNALCAVAVEKELLGAHGEDDILSLLLLGADGVDLGAVAGESLEEGLAVT